MSKNDPYPSKQCPGVHLSIPSQISKPALQLGMGAITQSDIEKHKFRRCNHELNQ